MILSDKIHTQNKKNEVRNERKHINDKEIHNKKQNYNQFNDKKKNLRLENLLQSFFAEEDRDLFCDKCKAIDARAKVSNLTDKPGGSSLCRK